jgi:hypothetical protein
VARTREASRRTGKANGRELNSECERARSVTATPFRFGDVEMAGSAAAGDASFEGFGHTAVKLAAYGDPPFAGFIIAGEARGFRIGASMAGGGKAVDGEVPQRFGKHTLILAVLVGGRGQEGGGVALSGLVIVDRVQRSPAAQ